jgi:hypothetical protein
VCPLAAIKIVGARCDCGRRVFWFNRQYDLGTGLWRRNWRLPNEALQQPGGEGGSRPCGSPFGEPVVRSRRVVRRPQLNAGVGRAVETWPVPYERGSILICTSRQGLTSTTVGDLRGGVRGR